MVRSEGLEPSLLLQNSDLNAARLPIPPRPQIMPGSGADIDEGLRDAKRQNATKFHVFSSAPHIPPNRRQ